ncbi:hypothetical protein MCOR34_011757 [Pyricularia oryzae]|nr:hypothetical protein MCOR34_011757 [Pyricularia oryzae]
MAEPLPIRSAKEAKGAGTPGKQLKATIDDLVAEWDERLARGNDWANPTTRSAKIRDEFVGEIWSQVQDDYDKMLQALKTYFEARLKEKDIAAEIQARVKQVESIKTTLERREKIKPFASVSDVFVEMHDLLGLRIVPRHSAARKKAEAFLNEEFRQLKPSAHISSERKVGEFWDVRFGAFQSYNHRLGLGEKSDQTVALSPYAGVMFEVQLTTWSKRVYNIIAHKLLYKGTQSLNKQAELSLDTLDGLTGLVEAQLQGLMDALEASVEESHNADISKLAEAKETALNRLNEIGPEVRAAIEDAFIGLADSLAANIPTDADAGQNLIDQLPEQRKPLVRYVPGLFKY